VVSRPPAAGPVRRGPRRARARPGRGGGDHGAPARGAAPPVGVGLHRRRTRVPAAPARRGRLDARAHPARQRDLPQLAAAPGRGRLTPLQIANSKHFLNLQFAIYNLQFHAGAAPVTFTRVSASASQYRKQRRSAMLKLPRGLRPLCALAVALAVAGPARAGDETWVGKTILVKRNGIKFGCTDERGAQVYHGTLTRISYQVRDERDGWLCVMHDGVQGWFDKDEAVLLEDAVD